MDKKLDNGVLMAVKSKKSEKAPDYFGEITINVDDLTNIEKHGDVYTVKLSGWKKRSKSGDVYLSLSVNRWVPKSSPKRNDDFDEEVPF